MEESLKPHHYEIAWFLSEKPNDIAERLPALQPDPEELSAFLVAMQQVIQKSTAAEQSLSLELP